MARRVYTGDEMATALAALEANGGNLKHTAKQLGIPASTLRSWRRGAKGADASPPKKKGAADPPAAPVPAPARRRLADQFEDVAHACLGLATDKLPLMSAKDLVIAAGVAVDKMRLLRDEPTAISREHHHYSYEQLLAMPYDELLRVHQETLGIPAVVRD